MELPNLSSEKCKQSINSKSIQVLLFNRSFNCVLFHTKMHNNNYSEDPIDIDDDDSSSSRSSRTRNSIDYGLRNLPAKEQTSLRKLIDHKFLSDFDPEKSSRERRKLSRKIYVPPSNSSNSRSHFVYDEKGRYRYTKSDVCDCLNESCVGCHFPCPSCRSPKCGSTCRVNRKWAFECIEHDGKDLIIKNRKI